MVFEKPPQPNPESPAPEKKPETTEPTSEGVRAGEARAAEKAKAEKAQGQTAEKTEAADATGPEKKEEEPAKTEKASFAERTKEAVVGIWERARGFLENPAIRKEILKTTLGVTASIVGLKSFYDVLEYFRERFLVRGAFGKGGLDAATEKLLKARWEIKEKPAEDRGEVKHAIKDLERRLKLTKEGAKKGSEQRRKLAELLSANRTQEKQTREERKAKVKGVLDNYTTTKVSGMQAARESLNTLLVATGAHTLRPFVYAFTDAAERYQRLAREARIGGGRVDIVRDVIVRGVTETVKDAIFAGAGKTKSEKGVSAVRAWGRIARYAGMGAVAFHPERADEAIDKALDALSGRLTLGQARENFQENIERYAPTLRNHTLDFGAVEKQVLPTPGIEAEISGPPPVEGVEGFPAEAPPAGAPAVAGGVAETVSSGVGVEGVFLKHLEYQGGKSVWNEGERQIAARFEGFKTLGGNSYAAEALKTYNIDRIKDTIVADPEKYGLNARDANIVTAEQLKTINWDGAVRDTFGDKGLTKELSDEQIEGILRSNRAMKQALAEGMLAREKISAAGGGAVPAETTGAPKAPHFAGEKSLELKPQSAEVPLAATEAEPPQPLELPETPPTEALPAAEALPETPVPEAIIEDQELIRVLPVEGQPDLTIRDYFVTRTESEMVATPEGEAVTVTTRARHVRVPVLWNENVPQGGAALGGEPVEILDPAGDLDTPTLVEEKRMELLNTEAKAVVGNLNRDFNEAQNAIITARELAFGTTREQEREIIKGITEKFGIERFRWAADDPLEFWKKNPTLDLTTVETIFHWNRASGNTLSGEVIKKYLDSGFLPAFQNDLFRERTIDLIQTLEYPTAAKVPLSRFLEWGGRGDETWPNWEKSGLFAGFEWVVKDGNLTVSFDVKDQAVDVDLLIYKNGTIAVDGHGQRNWHLKDPVSLTENALREALEFITRRDGAGAVSPSIWKSPIPGSRTR